MGCYLIMDVFIEIINRKPFAPKTWHILNTHNFLPKHEGTALQLLSWKHDNLGHGKSLSRIFAALHMRNLTH